MAPTGRTISIRSTCVAFLLACFFCPAQGIFAQETPSAACDRLAADPGIELGAIDPALAVPACEAAVREQPAAPRYLHQYARSLEAAGQMDAARRLYEWLATDKYAPAQYARARLLEQVEPGSKEAVELFAAAAAQGYDAAAASANADDASPLAQVVARVGSDPVKLLRFVADQIVLESYPGAMRGRLATLAAHAGSAGDKALLLAGLLQAAQPGAEVRFASCTLDRLQEDQLLEQVKNQTPIRPRSMLEMASTFSPQVKDAQTRQVADSLAQMWLEAVADVRRHAARIDELLRTAGHGDPMPVGVDALLGGFRNHYWVQLNQGGTWIDLDSSLTGAQPGRTLCPAEATSADFPEAAMHHIEVSVELEELADGTVNKRQLLSVSVPTPSLNGGGLDFMIAEPVGLGMLTPDVQAPDGYFNYTPLLRWDGTDRLGESFLLPQPLSAPKGLRGVMGGLGQLGDILSGDRDEQPIATRPENTVVALWLTLASVDPGGNRETTTVPIFDREGFAARSAGSPVGALPDLAEVDGEYRELGGVWDIAVLDGRPPASLKVPQGDGIAGLVAGLRSVHGMYDLLRNGLYAAAAGSDAPRFVRLQPGISLLGWLPREAASTASDYVMDVVLDDAVPLTAAARAAPTWAAARVIAERLTANSERQMARIVAAAAPIPPDTVDVAALFDQAAADNIPLLTMSGTEVPDGDFSAEAHARISIHLKEGHVLFAPARPASGPAGPLSGWWVFDPRTGAIYDELENGRHAELTEETVTTEPSRRAAPSMACQGLRVALVLNRVRVVLGLLSALSGDPGGEQAMKDGLKFEQAISEAIEKNKNTGKSVSDPPGGCSAG